MNYGQPLLICDSADFDGTNDYMTRGAGLDGAADSKTGILSMWVRLDGGTGAQQFAANATTLAGGTIRWASSWNTGSGPFEVVGFNAAASQILALPTSTSFTADGVWRHWLCSWDLANAAAHSYINDVSDIGSTTLTDDSVDYTVADFSIGARANAGLKTNGCFAEFYFAPGQYLDFSNVYQRRKFISSSGKPVYLGAAGASPTGTAPIVYQRVADAAAVATFATNLGTGGNFTITGTLATGSTSPSD